MDRDSEKYDRVLNILRKSKPVLDSTVEIEMNVMKRLSKKKASSALRDGLLDFLFGWVYIGWVRRSLITACVILVSIFVWQQSIILKQIDFLSRQVVNTKEIPVSSPSQQLGKLLMRYKGSSGFSSRKNTTISQEELNQLLESVNELKVQYKDLLELIDENPELKKMIEDKLADKNSKKTKL